MIILKKSLGVCGLVDLAQGRDKWRAVVRTVMYIRFQ